MCRNKGKENHKINDELSSAYLVSFRQSQSSRFPTTDPYAKLS